MLCTKNLVKIAAYGGLFVLGSAVYMQTSMKNRVRSAEFYKKALTTLRQHQPAVILMGEPIKEYGFDITNPERNNCSASAAQFEVKVEGPKDKGLMYFWANKADEEWIINRLELQLNNVPDKRLCIIAPPDDNASSQDSDKK